MSSLKKGLNVRLLRQEARLFQQRARTARMAAYWGNGKLGRAASLWAAAALMTMVALVSLVWVMIEDAPRKGPWLSFAVTWAGCLFLGGLLARSSWSFASMAWLTAMAMKEEGANADFLQRQSEDSSRAAMAMMERELIEKEVDPASSARGSRPRL